MKRTIVPNTAPKLRLIEAAEKLFAEHGFDVVSVRDITQAAGGNVAAVNYHFGSRDGLVAVVMNRYMMPVHEERLARLETAEQKWTGQAVPVEEVVDAFVRPLLTRVEKSELSEQLFYRLVGRIFGSHGNGIPDEIETRLSVSSERFARAFGKALPAVSEADLLWRLHFVVGGMIHMLTHGETLLQLSARNAGSSGMDSTLDRFLRFAVAGLRDGAMSPLLPHAVAATQVPDDGHRPPPPAAQVPDDGHRPPPAAAQVPDDGHRPPRPAATQVPDDGHRPPPPAAQVPDDGHRPPPPAAVETAPKIERKRASKVVADSPQVMFEF